jgi:hypothetical protein
MGRDAHEMSSGTCARKLGVRCQYWELEGKVKTFIPATDTFDFESLPQAIYGAFIQRPSAFPIGSDYCWLIVHTCEGLQSNVR